MEQTEFRKDIMDQKTGSSKIAGPVWAVIVLGGLLSIWALFALIGIMFGLDVPGVPL
jgi:hypothetical protein